MEMAGLSVNEAPEDDLAKFATADLSNTVSMLKTLGSDKDFNSLIQKGDQDGNVTDEQVSFSKANVACTDMFPTQAEIGFGNSLDDLCNDKYGAIESAYSSPVMMPAKGERTPILCASVGGKVYILDGHHRWSSCFMINNKAKMVCDIMQLGEGKPEHALKIMQMAIAAKAGVIKTKNFDGKDLMATNTNEVKSYIVDNIGEKEVALFGEESQGKLDTKEKIADEVANAHTKIIAMKGDFPRTIMPQAGESGTNQDDVNTALEKGMVNFKEPFNEARLNQISNIQRLTKSK